jgi:hypothetical protein
MTFLGMFKRLLETGRSQRREVSRSDSFHDRQKKLEIWRERALLKGHAVEPLDPPVFGDVFEVPPQPLPKNGFKFGYSSLKRQQGTTPFSAADLEAFRIHQTPAAPLTITTRGEGLHHFIRMSDWKDDSPVLAIFIRAGRSIETDVPVGSYRLKYAAGRTWFGEKYLFGPDTSYSQADSCLEFEQLDGRMRGHTIELFSQVGGNLTTSRIDSSRW